MDKKQKKGFKFRLTSDENSKVEVVSDAVDTDLAAPNQNQQLQPVVPPNLADTNTSVENSLSDSMVPSNIAQAKPKNSGHKKLRGFANIIIFILAAVSAFLAPTFWFQDAATFYLGVTVSITLGLIALLAILLLLQGKSHFEKASYSLPQPVQKLIRTVFLGISTFLILAVALPLLGFADFVIEKQNLLQSGSFAKESAEEKHRKLTAICDRAITISAYNPMLITLSSFFIDELLKDPVTALEYLDRPSLISKPGQLGDKVHRAELLYQIPGHRAEAEATFSKIEAKSNDWSLQYSLTLAFTNLKLYDRALVAANNFVRLRPDYSGAYLMRSQIYKALGEDSKADEDMNNYRKLSK